jgi:hypothetical protein
MNRVESDCNGNHNPHYSVFTLIIKNKLPLLISIFLFTSSTSKVDDERQASVVLLPKIVNAGKP